MMLGVGGALLWETETRNVCQAICRWLLDAIGSTVKIMCPRAFSGRQPSRLRSSLCSSGMLWLPKSKTSINYCCLSSFCPSTYFFFSRTSSFRFVTACMTTGIRQQMLTSKTPCSLPQDSPGSHCSHWAPWRVI